MKQGIMVALPLAYSAAADKASWEAMRQVFEEVFSR